MPSTTESARSVAPEATCWPTKVSSSADRSQAADHDHAGGELTRHARAEQPAYERGDEGGDEQGDRRPGRAMTAKKAISQRMR